VETYAKEIGLDVKQFKADLESQATVDCVLRERNQAEKLGLQGTPTIFIDGREYDLGKFNFADDLTDWIKLEIELTAK
jgi:predicted DsbA family dithiol-disulfide isomerase